MAIKTFLRLTKTDRKNAAGLVVLKLSRCVKGGDWREIDSVEVVSGQPGRQQFLSGKDKDSYSGSMRPTPEGYYFLQKPAWKGKVGDWNTVWSDGLGPVWIGMRKIRADQTKRDNFGIHLDGNAASAPGSAGCVVSSSKATIEKILSWWADKDYGAPEFITVNWGLGSVDSGNGSLSELPKSKEAPKPEPVKPKSDGVIPKKTDSSSGADQAVVFKLPWYLSLAKPLIIKVLKWGVAAALTALAGHLPFVAPYIEQIIAFLVALAEKML